MAQHTQGYAAQYFSVENFNSPFRDEWLNETPFLAFAEAHGNGASWTKGRNRHRGRNAVAQFRRMRR